MAGVQQKIRACLITTGHLAANPRIVKEAMALTGAGIHVHLIFTQYVDYLFDHDRQILAANPAWTYQSLDWSEQSVRSKLYRLIGRVLRSMPGKNNKINRNFWWQLSAASGYQADIYIGHNPGAMPVTVMAARKNKAKSGFDAEDFHRNETSDDENDPDVRLKTAIENLYMPQFDYLIAASPQIAAKYAALFNREVKPILNVFPTIPVDSIIQNVNRPLQLFWFSQTIGRNRGLEMIISAVNDTGIKMELHLLGKVSDDYKRQLLSLSNDQETVLALHFHAPVPAGEIFGLAAGFDIGFASEPGFSTNNRIALSNKLFTYIQCGLAVAASDTAAQTWFIQQYPQAGKLYSSIDELSDLLRTYHHDRKMLYETRNAAYATGKTQLNWEIEGEKLLRIIKPLLQI